MRGVLLGIVAVGALVAACGSANSSTASTPASEPRLQTLVASALQTQVSQPSATETPTPELTATPTPGLDYLKELRAKLNAVGQAESNLLDAQGGDASHPSFTASSLNAKFRAAVKSLTAAYGDLASAAAQVPAAVYDSFCTGGIRNWATAEQRYYSLISTALAQSDISGWNSAVDMQSSLKSLRDRAIQLCPNL